MEKRSRRRIRDLVARPASLGLSENEIGCARISMVARNTNVPFKGRIQKRKTYHLQLITFRLQRAAGPYRSAKCESQHKAAKIVSRDIRKRVRFNLNQTGRDESTMGIPTRFAVAQRSTAECLGLFVATLESLILRR